MRYSFITFGIREHRLLGQEVSMTTTESDPTSQVEATPVSAEVSEAPATAKELNEQALQSGRERIANAQQKQEELNKMSVEQQQNLVDTKLQAALGKNNSVAEDAALKDLMQELSQPGWKVSLDSETLEVTPIMPIEGEKSLGEQMRLLNKDISQLEEMMQQEGGEHLAIDAEITAMKVQVETLAKRQGGMTLGEKLTDDMKSGMSILSEPKATILEKLGGVMSAVGAALQFLSPTTWLNLNKKYGSEAASMGPATDILKDIANGDLKGKEISIAGHTLKVTDTGATIDGKKILATISNPLDNTPIQIPLISIEKKGSQLVLNGLPFGNSDIDAFIQAMEDTGTYQKNMISISIEGGVLGKPKKEIKLEAAKENESPPAATAEPPPENNVAQGLENLQLARQESQKK